VDGESDKFNAEAQRRQENQVSAAVDIAHPNGYNWCVLRWFIITQRAVNWPSSRLSTVLS